MAWTNLLERFGGDVDWVGYEDARAYLWHRQLHIFIHPFYYIEYGIAQLGALQVWANSKRDRQAALNAYKNSLELGGSRPLPELFAAAGCKFEFTAKTMSPLIALVRKQLEQPDGAENRKSQIPKPKKIPNPKSKSGKAKRAKTGSGKSKRAPARKKVVSRKVGRTAKSR